MQKNRVNSNSRSCPEEQEVSRLLGSNAEEWFFSLKYMLKVSLLGCHAKDRLSR